VYSEQRSLLAAQPSVKAGIGWIAQRLYSALDNKRVFIMVVATKAIKQTTPKSAVAKGKPAAKKVTVPTKKASVLAREAQAAKKRLLKLRADTKKAI
jgi:hypothetical protein